MGPFWGSSLGGSVRRKAGGTGPKTWASLRDNKGLVVTDFFWQASQRADTKLTQVKGYHRQYNLSSFLKAPAVDVFSRRQGR